MEFTEGTSLLEICERFDFVKPYRIISAKVNNVPQGLKFKVYHSRTIEFFDLRDSSARMVYIRSLCFLLCKATQDIFPESKVYIKHPISNGYYCKIEKDTDLTVSDIDLIRKRMGDIVAQNLPFHLHEVPTEDAISIFREKGLEDKVSLLETSEDVYSDYYTLGDTADYYYGRLVPSASYLDVWDIEQYVDGLLLRVPDRQNPEIIAPRIEQPKTFSVFSEDFKWNSIMQLKTVGDVNRACKSSRASELIQVSEALQEKKIVKIAEEIERRYNDNLRIVLITGPSSSGKSTFCKRLSTQLKACGLRPVSFSTDDYFVNRVESPLLPDGRYDFDNFETVDHRLLESDLMKLLAGEEVDMPEYNFVTGLREYNGKKRKLSDGSIILLEGIHALNPQLTASVEERSKFKIFISTLTSIPLDNHNWIPTSDNRLLRRIVRDYNSGAFSALESISQWQSVRDAEEKWINPYQENADVMFNSAYLIEFAVMRNHAEPILRTVPKNCPQYSEAHRLLKFLQYFSAVADKEIPPTSLLREFVGGSSFTY